MNARRAPFFVSLLLVPGLGLCVETRQGGGLPAEIPVLAPALPTLPAAAAASGAPAAASIPAVPASFQAQAAELAEAVAKPEAPGGDGSRVSAQGAALFDSGAGRRGPDAAALGAPEGFAAAAPALPAYQGHLDDLVDHVAPRRIEGVFFQQEQEGNMEAVDPRDSAGDIFAYYRPAELRPALLEEAARGLGFWGKLAYGLRSLPGRAVGRLTPERIWTSLPQEGKLKYLVLLEAQVDRERGHEGAWKGKDFLLLERSPQAPAYLAKHPHIERLWQTPGEKPERKFMTPEIVTAKDSPARTIDEAIGRTQQIIADTGHAGTQYHVFIRAEPARLAAALPRLQAMLQTINDALFLQAAMDAPQNLLHPFLLPWHQGRSQRVARLIRAASPEASVPLPVDLDNEKFSFVGFRYWGIEEGRMVVSLELRGTSIPFKSRRGSGAARGLETMPEAPERDYSTVRSQLALLGLYASKLSRGEAPPLAAPVIGLDVDEADRALKERARARGVPEAAYLDLRSLSAALVRRSGNLPVEREALAMTVHPSLLFPFAYHKAVLGTDAGFDDFLDVLLKQSIRLKGVEEHGEDFDSVKNIEYTLWQGYRSWAGGALKTERERLESVFRAVAP